MPTIQNAIINAESARAYGEGDEFLKTLAFMGRGFELFFVSGNLVLLESELKAGSLTDAPTNAVRPMAGASDALNVVLGFDSPNAKHSAMLS